MQKCGNAVDIERLQMEMTQYSTSEKKAQNS